MAPTNTHYDRANTDTGDTTYTCDFTPPADAGNVRKLYPYLVTSHAVCYPRGHTSYKFPLHRVHCNRTGGQR